LPGYKRSKSGYRSALPYHGYQVPHSVMPFCITEVEWQSGRALEKSLYFG